MQIIVAGMHRSGTSAVARLINLMGASVGPPASIGKPAADNEKGFWEHRQCRELNDELLAACGASWANPWPVLSSNERALTSPQLKVRASELVFEMDTNRPWVLKDPRFSLTFDFWLPLLEAPLLVVPFRHPVEVAQSLRKRDGMGLLAGMALWEAYNHAVLGVALQIPTILVPYTRLLADPQAAALALHSFLTVNGAEGLHPVPKRQLAAFVDPRLRHHDATEEGQEAWPACRSLYQRMEDLAAGKQEVGALSWTPSEAGRELLEDINRSRRLAQQNEQMRRELEALGVANSALEEQLKASIEQQADYAVKADHRDSAGGERVGVIEAELAACRELLIATKDQLVATVLRRDEEAAGRVALAAELAACRDKSNQVAGIEQQLAEALSARNALDVQLGVSEEQTVAAKEQLVSIENQLCEALCREAELEGKLRVSQEACDVERCQMDELLSALSAALARHSVSPWSPLDGAGSRNAVVFNVLQRLEATLGASESARAEAHQHEVESLRSRLAEAQAAMARVESDVSTLLELRNRIYPLVERQEKQRAADIRQLARWMDDSVGLMRATFESARWRTGNFAISLVERLLLRGRPRLARDHIEQIERSFRSWWHARLQEGQDSAWLQALLDMQTRVPNVASFTSVSMLTDGVASADEDRLAVTEGGMPARLPAKQEGRLDFLVFPVIDWHFRVQRPQQIARELGARGHRVFYLSCNPVEGCEAPGFEVLESPEEGVWLIRLRLACHRSPNLYMDKLKGEALEQYVLALDAFRDWAGIMSPVSIVDLPFWLPLVRAVPGNTVVYDCMDHHAGFSTNNSDMLEQEHSLLKESDLVVVTSDWLQQEVGKIRKTTLIRNGAQVDRFESVESPMRPPGERKVVGYLGAISDWFDFDLVAHAARRMPEVDFVLVGDVTHPKPDKVAGLANVQLVGEVPYSEAPAWVHSFDVCIIPFKISELTLATNPVKAYEYLSAGKPVVATPMPELERMDGMVAIAETPAAFTERLRAALDEQDPLLGERRREWARQHDWSARGQAFEHAVLALHSRASVVVLAWNNLEFTRACVDSLLTHTDYPDWELILVDNGSTDDTAAYFEQVAAAHPDRAKLVLNTENLGFAAGNNRGLDVATGDVLVVLNNDTFVTPGWLPGLVGHLRRNPQMGIVGPVTNNIGNEARIDVAYGNMEEMLLASREWTRDHARQLFEAPVVAFFCCAIPRRVFDEVGPLCEEFGQGFFEDDDYCNRIRALGYKIAIADDIFVHHHLSASFSTLKEQRRQELFERNKAIYEKRWGTWRPHRYRSLPGK